jgi:hypothetical protein
VAERYQSDAGSIASRRLHDGRPIPADLFDVTRQKLRGLMHGGVFVIGHHDLASRQCDVTGGGRPGPDP